MQIFIWGVHFIVLAGLLYGALRLMSGVLVVCVHFLEIISISYEIIATSVIDFNEKLGARDKRQYPRKEGTM